MLLQMTEYSSFLDDDSCFTRTTDDGVHNSGEIESVVEFFGKSKSDADEQNSTCYRKYQDYFSVTTELKKDDAKNEYTIAELSETYEKVDVWIEGTRKVILEDNRKEIMEKRKALARRCAKVTIVAVVNIILVALIVCAIFAMINATKLVFQKDKELFVTRRYTFPFALPEGVLRLRSVDFPLPNSERTFTAFIASSQSHGILHVMTNARHPQYFNGFFVKHPEITDVEMVTDDIFCSPFRCFQMEGNTGFYGTIKYFSDFSPGFSVLTEIPTPAEHKFVHARNCSYSSGPKLTSTCSIVLQYADYLNTLPHRKFALIVNTTDTKRIEFDPEKDKKYDLSALDQRKSMEARNELNRFRPKEIDDDLLIGKSKNIQVLSLTPADKLHLQFFEKNNITRRVGFCFYGDEVEVTHYFSPSSEEPTFLMFPSITQLSQCEIVIKNNRAAIATFVDNETLHVCQLSRSQIECYRGFHL